MPRLLRREPAIDEAELELARARSLERLRQIGAPRQTEEPEVVPAPRETTAVATLEAAEDVAGTAERPADEPAAQNVVDARRPTIHVDGVDGDSEAAAIDARIATYGADHANGNGTNGSNGSNGAAPAEATVHETNGTNGSVHANGSGPRWRSLVNVTPIPDTPVETPVEPEAIVQADVQADVQPDAQPDAPIVDWVTDADADTIDAIGEIDSIGEPWELSDDAVAVIDLPSPMAAGDETPTVTDLAATDQAAAELAVWATDDGWDDVPASVAVETEAPDDTAPSIEISPWREHSEVAASVEDVADEPVDADVAEAAIEVHADAGTVATDIEADAMPGAIDIEADAMPGAIDIETETETDAAAIAIETEPEVVAEATAIADVAPVDDAPLVEAALATDANPAENVAPRKGGNKAKRKQAAGRPAPMVPVEPDIDIDLVPPEDLAAGGWAPDTDIDVLAPRDLTAAAFGRTNGVHEPPTPSAAPLTDDAPVAAIEPVAAIADLEPGVEVQATTTAEPVVDEAPIAEIADLERATDVEPIAVFEPGADTEIVDEITELDPVDEIATFEPAADVEPYAFEPTAEAEPESAYAVAEVAEVVEAEPVVEYEPVLEPVAAVVTPIEVPAAPVAQVPAPTPIVRPAATPRPKPASAPKRAKSKSSTVKWPAQASCPYCAQLLVPAPTTHKRCPRCKQRVIVRRVDDRVAFLTEAAVAVFESERRRVAESRHWIGPRNQWIRLAEAAGAPPERIAKVNDTLATPESTFAARSVYFAAVDRGVRDARAEHDWPLAVRLRRAQAVAVLKAAGTPTPLPDDVVELHRDAAAIELRGIQELAREAELVAGPCCPACDADTGHIYRINAELHEPRLPHLDCPSGLCSCRWRLSDRDRANLERLLRGGSRP